MSAPPSTQLLAQLNALKADPAIYAGERGGLLDDTGVLALHEGFEELAEMLRDAKDEYDIVEALKAWPVDLAIHMTYERYYYPAEEEVDEPERDHGFYEPGGWYYSIVDEAFQQLVEKVGRQRALEDMSPEPARFNRLDEAIEYVTSHGGLEPSSSPGWYSGMWYTTVEDDWDSYGDVVHYSFHVEGSLKAAYMLHRALWDQGMLL